jgi:hypothetical protein
MIVRSKAIRVSLESGNWRCKRYSICFIPGYSPQQSEFLFCRFALTFSGILSLLTCNPFRSPYFDKLLLGHLVSMEHQYYYRGGGFLWWRHSGVAGCLGGADGVPRFFTLVPGSQQRLSRGFRVASQPPFGLDRRRSTCFRVSAVTQ